MVSLTNQARLLAAQEFNRRVLEAKARAGKRITTSSKRVGVLTGRVAKVDPKTKRVVGVTRTKSKTRLNTERLLRAEIKRQEELARKETDLERFLRNERDIRAGRVSSQAVKRQIAARKRKGLRATPAQKAALAGITRAGDIRRLTARAARKRGRGIREGLIQSPEQLLGVKATEALRATDLGSAPFGDPLFEFGGRSRQEVIRRGGTFGRRVGGETAGQQLDFVRKARKGTSSARISFAKSLLGDTFGQASRGQLLSVVGSQVPSRDPVKRARGALTQIPLAPPTFEQVLRQDVGLFTTVAKPVTKPKITKAERRSLVSARKAEDFAKASQARREVTRTPPRVRGQTLDDLERTLGTELDLRNLERAERQFGFGQPREAISVAGFQAVERVPKGRKLTPTQRRQQAEARQRETEALRAQAGFPAFGRTFGQEEIFRPSGAQEPISALVPATPRPSPAREEIRVLGERIVEEAPQRRDDFFSNIFGGLQSFFGGAPLVESRAAGVRVETGEALAETGDIFRGSVSPTNIFATGQGLARGELIEGITISEAIGESPLVDRDSPLSTFFNFFR